MWLNKPLTLLQTGVLWQSSVPRNVPVHWKVLSPYEKCFGVQGQFLSLEVCM